MGSEDQGKSLAIRETEHTFAKWLAGVPMVIVPVVALLVGVLKMTEWWAVAVIGTSSLATYTAYFVEQRRKEFKKSRETQALQEEERKKHAREAMESQEKENQAKHERAMADEEARVRYDGERLAEILAMAPIYRNKHYPAFRMTPRVCGGCGRAFPRSGFRKLEVPHDRLACLCGSCCPTNVNWRWMWPESLKDYQP